LGDFYEMFEEDALIASRALDIALTTRNRHSDDPVPFCGVPYHTADLYIAKLIRQGFRVALVEQVEDPRMAKGLVRREVVRIISPGAVLEASLLEAKEHHFLAAVALEREGIGLAFVDLSTGEFLLDEARGETALREASGAIGRFEPKEILVSEDRREDPRLAALRTAFIGPTPPPVHPVEGWVFGRDEAYQRLLRQFHTPSLEGYGCEGLDLGIRAGGAALHYLEQTQRGALSHVIRVRPAARAASLVLDQTALRTLEIFRNLSDGSTKGTLWEVLDETVTAMGGRRLRSWLLQPLLDPAQIGERQQAVENLHEEGRLRAALRSHFKEVQDLERLISRISLGAAHPRDLAALRQSLQALPAMQSLLGQATAPLLRRTAEGLDDLQDLHRLLEAALVDDPPNLPREGGIIREGHSPELDTLRSIKQDARRWIVDLEARERERTGIPTLRVGYNRVFGYYLEATKAQLGKIPAEYQRKQTLTGGERFTTAELRELEEKILHAEERIQELEQRLFVQLREAAAKELRRVLQTAEAVAVLDALQSLAEAAARRGYVRPRVDPGEEIAIVDGRHPVVEAREGGEPFVPNDISMDGSDRRILIITGPNMAGKSTYLRQVALIVLLAQMGSFVPAREARIGTVDRIFTRIGATDALFRGQSTFMVEMQETANLLHNATPRSLIVLDEVGRGTSTYDGLSIAWAVVEHLAARTRARTLFATHYHELTALAGTVSGVRNCVALVREWNEEIIFLRKIVEGSADRSYGLHVATLAGVPAEVVARARTILEDLEGSSREDHPQGRDAGMSSERQLGLFCGKPQAAVREILDLPLDRMTPIEALNYLAALQRRLLNAPPPDSTASTDISGSTDPR
jgi:DNA mismatch repair protein MutS